MGTYHQSLYQIVYSTKQRNPSLHATSRPLLFRYLGGVLTKKKCHPYQIGGIEDHIHIVTDIHPTIAVSNLVKDLKLAADDFIKNQLLFPNFCGWQNGYASFTYSIDAKDNLIRYVLSQEEHHRKKGFIEELRELLKEHKIDFDERYLI